MIINLDGKTISLGFVSIYDICPEEEAPVLVLTKAGQLHIATYMADEMGDYWINSNTKEEDHFFAMDEVMYWASLQ